MGREWGGEANGKRVTWSCIGSGEAVGVETAAQVRGRTRRWFLCGRRMVVVVDVVVEVVVEVAVEVMGGSSALRC